MTPEQRKDRTRFLGREILLMIGLLAIGVALGVTGALIWRQHGELSRIFVTGTVTLVFGALLGGVVSLLIADFDRRRVQRAAQLEFISNILTELKTVYDRVDRGRTLIAAHQSAKTYGEQMREFIDARVKLLAVERALRFDERRTAIAEVKGEVNQMENYLHSLTEEFIRNYKDISQAQSIYEAEMEKALKASPSSVPENHPWVKLKTLAKLEDFLLGENTNTSERPLHQSEYTLSFIQPLDSASEKLREALERELSGASTKPSQSMRDARYPYDVVRRAEHAQRPGFSISELQISPTQNIPWHYHNHVQDTFYVIAGRIRILLHEPDEEVGLGPGEVFSIAARRPHFVRSDADGSAVFLVLQNGAEYDFVPLE